MQIHKYIIALVLKNFISAIFLVFTAYPSSNNMAPIKEVVPVLCKFISIHLKFKIIFLFFMLIAVL